jgi:Asp-tRNA(Asn)/Glu-tRNA(Gln) amidotransferase A subunit family amidase
LGQLCTQYDVILTPTLGAPPQKLGYLDTVNIPTDEFIKPQSDHSPFTWLHNVTDLPAMSVPLFWNAQGLPLGVQFGGRYADEATLYSWPDNWKRHGRGKRKFRQSKIPNEVGQGQVALASGS